MVSAEMPQIVIVHQWLVADRGAEVVLRELMRLFPEAPVACLLKDKAFNPTWLAGRRIIQSPLAMLPGAARYYRQMLALHPWAIRRLLLPEGTRFVLSADAAMIKGLALREGVKHACYCHSPPRYLWDQMENYKKVGGWAAKLQNIAFTWSAKSCRAFDKRSAANVDHFIANSNFVAARIQLIYGRKAEVIFPPVGVADFKPDSMAGEYYLIVSHLVPYKRIDLAVEACSHLQRPLMVVGEGPEMNRLKAIAGPSVTFRGRLSRTAVQEAVEGCRAFLYPQVEDFGITAVEAQAAGRPVIAFRAGGALETVVEGKTGLFFNEQTCESLSEAIQRFELLAGTEGSRLVARSFSPEACRANAERFRPERFRAEIKAFLELHYPELFAGYAWPENT